MAFNTSKNPLRTNEHVAEAVELIRNPLGNYREAMYSATRLPGGWPRVRETALPLQEAFASLTLPYHIEGVSGIAVLGLVEAVAAARQEIFVEREQLGFYQVEQMQNDIARLQAARNIGLEMDEQWQQAAQEPYMWHHANIGIQIAKASRTKYQREAVVARSEKDDVLSMGKLMQWAIGAQFMVDTGIDVAHVVNKRARIAQVFLHMDRNGSVFSLRTAPIVDQAAGLEVDSKPLPTRAVVVGRTAITDYLEGLDQPKLKLAKQCVNGESDPAVAAAIMQPLLKGMSPRNAVELHHSLVARFGCEVTRRRGFGSYQTIKVAGPNVIKWEKAFGTFNKSLSARQPW